MAIKIKSKSKSILFLLISLILYGCASTAPKDVKISSSKSETISIGYMTKGRLSEGYFALVEKEQGKWYIRYLSNKSINQRKNKNQEILYLNYDLSYIQPYFGTNKYFDGKTFTCSFWFHDSSYTSCNSNLTKVTIPESIGMNIFAIPLTFGLASGTHRVLNRKEVAKIVHQTNLIEYIEDRKESFDQERFLDKYRDEFKKINTSLDAQNFIVKYSNNDPEGLVAKAEENKEKLLFSEKRMRERKKAYNDLLRRQKQNIGTTVCRDEQDYIGNITIRYTGYVENYANNKIQIRVAHANVVGVPGVRPTNFQPSIIWDNPDRWDLCTMK